MSGTQQGPFTYSENLTEVALRTGCLQRWGRCWGKQQSMVKHPGAFNKLRPELELGANGFATMQQGNYEKPATRQELWPYIQICYYCYGTLGSQPVPQIRSGHLSSLSWLKETKLKVESNKRFIQCGHIQKRDKEIQQGNPPSQSLGFLSEIKV